MTTAFAPLIFVSPMQSWSDGFFFGKRRTTNECPTKSGIVGLIGNVSGVDRDNTQEIDLINRQKIDTFHCHHDSIYADYQTVGGDTWAVPTYSGKPQSNGINAIIMKKEYLINAITGAIIIGDKQIIEIIANNLLKPQRMPYFGKKNCIPSKPIIESANNIFETYDAAFFYLMDQFRSIIFEKNIIYENVIITSLLESKKINIVENSMIMNNKNISLITSSEHIYNDSVIDITPNNRTYNSRRCLELSFYVKNIFQTSD